MHGAAADVFSYGFLLYTATALCFPQESADSLAGSSSSSNAAATQRCACCAVLLRCCSEEEKEGKKERKKERKKKGRKERIFLKKRLRFPIENNAYPVKKFFKNTKYSKQD